MTILALQFIKVVGRLFFSAAISKQLNAAPYLHDVPCPLLQEETMSSVRYACWSTHLCMCTKLENGILRNGQQQHSAVNSFINI